MKQCNKCKQYKSLEEFHKDNTKKDGLKSICKTCRSTKTEKYKRNKSLDINLTSSIHKAIKENKSGRQWEDTTGLTLLELRDIIEERFEDGMTWDNYGTIWVITKIVSPSYYNYSNISANEFRKCWSKKNFIPRFKNKNKITKQEIAILTKEYNLYDILPFGNLPFNVLDIDKKKK